MKLEALHKIAEAIHKSHHQHLGVTADPPKPPQSPVAVRLDHRDMNSFTNATDRARQQWPDAGLCLIGSHGAVGTTNIDDPDDTLPPGFLQFLDPEVLLALSAGDLGGTD